MTRRRRHWQIAPRFPSAASVIPALAVVVLTTSCSGASSPAGEPTPTSSKDPDFADVPTLTFDGTFIRLDERSPMVDHSDCSTDDQGQPNGFTWRTDDGRNLVDTRFVLRPAGGSTVEYLHIVAGGETLIDLTLPPYGEVSAGITRREFDSNDFTIMGTAPRGPRDIENPTYRVAFRCKDQQLPR